MDYTHHQAILEGRNMPDMVYLDMKKMHIEIMVMDTVHMHMHMVDADLDMNIYADLHLEPYLGHCMLYLLNQRARQGYIQKRLE